MKNNYFKKETITRSLTAFCFLLFLLLNVSYSRANETKPVLPPAPANDECAGAIALPVNASCTYVGYTNASATASAGVPAPGCSSYLGGDVWFSVVVPANGQLIIDMQTGVILDSGMAIYSGACGALTLIECDDDDSANGAMSYINRTGLTPGSTIYIRVWEYGNNNNGTFSICVSTPPNCVAPVSQASAFVLGAPTSTTLPVTFTGTANGYLVIQSLTNTLPAQPVNGVTYSAANIATLGAGLTFVQSSALTSFTASGLAGNTRYYYFIYAANYTACGGGPVYNASGPLTGNGTTCPIAPSPASGSAITTTGFTLNWTSSVGGGASAVTYTVQVCTDVALTVPVAGFPMFISAPTTSLNVSGLNPSTIYYYRIRANNGCITGATTGNITTSCLNPTAQPTALILTQPANGTVNGTFTAASPAPSNYLVVYNTTGTTPAPVNGTTYTIGATFGAGDTVGDIDANTTFSVPGLSSTITYYFFVFSYNYNNCGGGPLYLAPAPLTGNATIPFFYCTPAPTSVDGTGITNVTMGTINNTTGAEPTRYGDYSAMVTTAIQFSTVNFSITYSTGYTYNTLIWVDWNNDGDFVDAGEEVYNGVSAATNPTTLSGSFVIPAGATLGNHRVRIGGADSATPIPCYTGSYASYEDYTINVTAATACVAPTTSPTALILTQPTSGTVNGSFTAAAAPAPSSYLVVYNTTGIAPVPVNGTTYTIGGTVGAGNIVADTDTNTTFSLVGLNGSTTYYFFVFSNNALCTGGPLYRTTSPATGNAVVPFYYCIANNPVNTNRYISGVTTTGGVANISRTGTGFAAGGYIDYSATDFVSQNSGLSFTIAATHPVTFFETYGYSVWIDWNNDGDFADAGENVIATGYLNSPAALGSITIPGGTPAGNYRMRIRNAYSNNPPPACGAHSFGETEDYRITCLGPLPCAGNPSALIVNVTTMTTTTINWTAASPVPANGYQYYLSTSATAPTQATAPTGSTGAGITTLNLTGLSNPTTYYIWIRSNCGGGLGQGAWIGTSFFQPDCLPGGGAGTSALACPSVVSGGLGLLGADPAPITCSSSPTVDLEANFLQLGETTSYTATSIAYNPPYQFGCMANPLFINQDDVWSNTVNLPFNFCFYGNTYNQCLIGANGVITFDLVGNTPGGSNTWSFASNLPNTSLFENTIFGVYQDIDPNVGGEIGWELITLNTGCRALVASWNDVPMYSATCNSLLYTGMIVLYENTNIVEVYIKKKDICASWNSGNAIVGMQNAAGNQAVVAPNRNGLDADWATTNEAWRFTPSGASLTSIKWYEGSGTGGPVVASTNPAVGGFNTISVTPAATTIYTAEVTYNLCGGAVSKVTEETTVTVSGNKVWNGSVSTNWNVANNWTPVGVPTNLDCVVIPNVANDPIISGASFNAFAKTLTGLTGCLLTANATTSITVTDAVTVNAGGIFNFKNSASLVQINNVANTGNINMERTTNMRRQDYVYWSSPVANFPVASISPTTPSGYIYKWNPTILNTNGGWGNWVNTTENMVNGKGYIVRGPSAFSLAVPAAFTATFTGVPNNGTITNLIQRAGYTAGNYLGTNGATISRWDDNWNLVGNPYPSAIDAIAFLTLPANNVIDGTVRLWTHGTLPTAVAVDPFYDNFVYNYTGADYIVYNSAGASAGPSVFNGKIGAGQSFLVLMNDGAAGSNNVTFNNTMRSNAYNNAQFYRNSEPQGMTSDTPLERNRIWLDLISSTGTVNRTMVGYIEGASEQKDRMFDAITDYKNAQNFYSLIEDEVYLIQGRSLPFSAEDKVPMGLKIPTDGTYSIAIATVDGLFENGAQTVYLEDQKLDVIHDLTTTPYQFTSDQGIINDRFVLRYTNSDNALGNANVDFNNSVQVITNEKVTVYSSQEAIKDITVYDVLGRKIDEYKNVGVMHFPLKNLNPTTNALFLKITLENGIVVTQKIVY